MRNVWVSGLCVVVLAATACSVRIGGDAGGAPPSSPRRASAPPPPPPPPAAAPAPAPAPAPARTATVGGFGNRRAPVAAAPAPAPVAPAAPPPAQATRPGFGTSTVATNTPMALNVAKLQELRARNPKSCGMQEVAPGAWVRIDCQLYAPSAKAVAHFSPRKALAVSQKKTLWKGFGKLSVSQKSMFMSKRIGAGGVPGRGAGLDKAGPGERGGGGDFVGESFPNTVDHRADGLEGPIRDQGPVGSCTAFSLAATIDNGAIRAGKMSAQQADLAASPSHVWSAYGYPQMGVAADANVGRSIATLTTFSQDNRETCKLSSPAAMEDCGMAFQPAVLPGSWKADPTLAAKVEKAEATGGYKIAAFERLETQPPKVDELVSILAGGNDLWIAMKIDGLAWSSGKIRDNGGVIPNWTRQDGGHAVVMSGYRDTPTGRQYLIHNSWGLSWADKGYSWVTEEMVVKNMHYAYRVKLSDGVKKEDLTDDDCAPDELVDIGLGICGLICPNGMRPNTGCTS